MKEIDEMDIFYYFDVLAYRIKKSRNKETEKVAYIDELDFL
ncbi:hypothetical protein CLPU_38c00020 [Gottschalkia purinilytica]|uniref:Uncharacterized protein n=1 Tax=Gottschalkia purinilytica TaxID=1503 RepID=A0A0L0W682_GOTPU|nr:hypothetical protein [Gottschalkia purinilytica]KNF06982.1 hypothetical protein CLPU_38c00020 [Gottschalkia purinilytica]